MARRPSARKQQVVDMATISIEGRHSGACAPEHRKHRIEKRKSGN
ncbi:MAG TPA: hypothetical protein VMJ13_05680 [Candidatus Acidoferrum sp.]|nr:hypothetical protein [Candidatus Acidoferrum sp.]